MARSVLVLSGYFVLWAAVHSLLANRQVKEWVYARLGSGFRRWYRMLYVILAGVTLLPLPVLFAILPDRVLYVVSPPWRWLMVAGQGLALVGVVGAVLQAGPTYFLGLSQLMGHWPEEDAELQVRGFYCWVRHPMYLFSILLLWLTPAMTVNLLALNVLFTLYMYVGSFHEEMRLRKTFGAAYHHYQRHVPRLVPWRGRCYRPPERRSDDV
jgi:protein-S-isoprenylcysteine O-methyltransferase Ste14